MKNPEVEKILQKAESICGNIDAIIKEDSKMNEAKDFLINEYKINKRYFCKEGSRPTIEDVIKTCVEFGWASARSYFRTLSK